MSCDCICCMSFMLQMTPQNKQIRQSNLWQETISCIFFLLFSIVRERKLIWSEIIFLHRPLVNNYTHLVIHSWKNCTIQWTQLLNFIEISSILESSFWKIKKTKEKLKLGIGIFSALGQTVGGKASSEFLH